MIHRSFWFYVGLSKIEPYFIFLNIPKLERQGANLKEREKRKPILPYREKKNVEMNQ
jgi:hypothetical protein